MGRHLVFVSRRLPGMTRLGQSEVTRIDQGSTESRPTSPTMSRTFFGSRH